MSTTCAWAPSSSLRASDSFRQRTVTTFASGYRPCGSQVGVYSRPSRRAAEGSTTVPIAKLDSAPVSPRKRTDVVASSAQRGSRIALAWGVAHISTFSHSFEFHHPPVSDRPLGRASYIAVIGVRMAAFQSRLVPKCLSRWRERMAAVGWSGRKGLDGLDSIEYLGYRAAGREGCPGLHHLIDVGEAVFELTGLYISEREKARRDLIQPGASTDVAVRRDVHQMVTCGATLCSSARRASTQVNIDLPSPSPLGMLDLLVDAGNHRWIDSQVWVFSRPSAGRQDSLDYESLYPLPDQKLDQITWGE